MPVAALSPYAVQILFVWPKTNKREKASCSKNTLIRNILGTPDERTLLEYPVDTSII